MGREGNIQRMQGRAAAVIVITALGVSLAGCGGGGGGGSTADTDIEHSTSAATSSSPAATATPGAPALPTAQPAQTEGRLLASNCFQCHGTMGTGGFDSIRGRKASEVLDYLTKTANRDIMAAHAQGYTREQLQVIITYLQQ